MRRLLASLFVFLPVLLAPSLTTDLTPDLSTELQTVLGGSSGFAFACPAEAELCKFTPADTQDTTCAVGQGWGNVLGDDATMCDNGTYDATPDVTSRLDRLSGFWSHTALTTATVLMQYEITGIGGGSSDPDSYLRILTSGFGNICSFQMGDIGTTSPANTQIMTATDTDVISGFQVVVGSAFWVRLDYDSPAATCRVRISSIANSPDTGDIADQVVTAAASAIADIVRLQNSLASNLFTGNNLAVCPDECTIP